MPKLLRQGGCDRGTNAAQFRPARPHLASLRHYALNVIALQLERAHAYARTSCPSIAYFGWHPENPCLTSCQRLIRRHKNTRATIKTETAARFAHAAGMQRLNPDRIADRDRHVKPERGPGEKCQVAYQRARIQGLQVSTLRN